VKFSGKFVKWGKNREILGKKICKKESKTVPAFSRVYFKKLEKTVLITSLKSIICRCS
jgi:hypothetical protein